MTKSALLAALLAMTACATAAAKGLDTMPSAGGAAPSWSPYRYVTMAPQHPSAEGRTTTLARIDRKGGEIDRWWFLRGSWLTPSLAYDRSGGGPSANGSKLLPDALFDTRTFAVRRPADPLLAFARTPRGPGNLLARYDVVGRSSRGRPIELQQTGDPKWSGELLVFGCIHGDECAASGIKPTTGGCPDPSADIYLVPSLNPDGARAGSRLNGRGVDLNRNFPSGWKPIGSRWDPQYAGPRPFSEREARLAARLIDRLRPEATIWFHQYRGPRPFVRAWGQSAGAGRHFARLAGIPFHSLRWPAGTAPNWQNHRYAGSSSFVVELPRGRLEPEMGERLTKALVRMGRWVRED